MKIVVVVRSQVVRRWHITLLSRLGELPGTRAALDWRPTLPAPTGVASLMQLEALLHRVPRPGPSTAAGPEAVAGIDNDLVGADLRLLLDDVQDRHAVTPAWSLAFDGVMGEEALLNALILRRPPVVTIQDCSGAMIASARPGSDTGGVLLIAFEDTLQRLVTFIVAAFAGAALAPPYVEVPVHDRAIPHVLPLAVEAITQAAVRRIYKLCFNAPHWRVGWRADCSSNVPRDLSTSGSRWQVVPDDGSRFYADPFGLAWQGSTTLFVEEFPHRLQKGVISAVTFGPHGPVGTPRPVLETETHLSYPHVFVHEKTAWMVPESSGAHRIDLFRATAYPGGWVRDATLVDNVCASDATLFHRDGVWWMFATVQCGGGAFSDALHIWMAPRLQGPWSPHPLNPVLIDVASARPAGAFFRLADGTLVRPVQDCRRGYGAALGLASVTHLDRDWFAQKMEPVRQGPEWRGRLHTYNRCGPYEFIDGSARSHKKFWSPRS